MLRRLGSALGGSKGRASSGQQEQQQQPPSPSASSPSSTSSKQKQQQQQPERPAHAMMAQRQPPSSAAASLLPRVPPSLGNRTSSASGGVPRLAYVYSVPLIHRIGALPCGWWWWWWCGCGIRTVGLVPAAIYMHLLHTKTQTCQATR